MKTTLKQVYSYALEAYNTKYPGQYRFIVKDGLIVREHKVDYIFNKYDSTENLRKIADFQIISYYDSDYEPAIHNVTISDPNIGFSFKIYKDDPGDYNRLVFVYDVTIAASNSPLLLPFAKKQHIPKWEKINKKFPGKVSRDEYLNINIHDKEAVIKLIKKILS